MRSVLLSSAACFWLVGVSAQAGIPGSASQAESGGARTMTINGCLEGGPSKFTLTNVAASQPPSGSKESSTAGTAVARAYDLVAGEGVSLAPHAGRKVELVGVAGPATGGESAPETKAGAAAKPKTPRPPNPQFTVTSVKMISPICLQ